MDAPHRALSATAEVTPDLAGLDLSTLLPYITVQFSFRGVLSCSTVSRNSSCAGMWWIWRWAW
ncbi:hypothetical protein SBA1_910027 [Candidatus Sulfotelmatobacter kueseliae]|uniref:Uncharacterized protein n=1 Tax=Candidatus Sulfotelmatobacter kueseliae TaxID=2042962 RepID=A0A2U3LCK8_9BACT|nr:hypothetical protein SBA1_910027 [Candidatus Sulfotelmatobacter kueseliae]